MPSKPLIAGFVPCAGHAAALGYDRIVLLRPRYSRATGWALLTALAISILSICATDQARAQNAQNTVGNSTVLAEVIVTARKRSEDVRDVPISMTTLSSQEISELGARDFRELDGYIPNMVQVGLESNVSPTISIRGISSDARNSGFESGTSVYVDGVYTGRPVSWSSELVDIEDIEVLRGPQGTLFGKNTIGGALNITTRKPTDEFIGSGQVEFGNFDLLRIRGSLSGPLVAKEVFGSVSVYKTERHGFQTNVVDGKDYWNKNDYGARARLRFAPSEALEFAVELAQCAHQRPSSLQGAVPRGTLRF